MNLVDIFDDFDKGNTKLIYSFFKLSLIFGPGFLTIAYFNRTLFLQLDWLKLISLSALFSFFFLTPVVLIDWIRLQFYPWKFQILYAKQRYDIKKLIRSTHKQQASLKAIAANSTNDLQLKQRITVLDKEVKSMEARAISYMKRHDRQYSKFKKNINELNIGVADVLLNNWFYLILLFFYVSLTIILDYYSHKPHLEFKDFFSNLIGIFFVGYTCLTLGLSFLTFFPNLTKSKKIKLAQILIGVILLVVSVVLIAKFEGSIAAHWKK